MKEETKEITKSELDTQPPVLYIDTCLGWKRTDGVHFIRMGTGQPEGFRAQVQFMTTNDDLRQMLDVLCEEADYYPVKVEKTANHSHGKRTSRKNLQKSEK